jgi:hypothetical protein
MCDVCRVCEPPHSRKMNTIKLPVHLISADSFTIFGHSGLVSLHLQCAVHLHVPRSSPTQGSLLILFIKII